jgi:transcriptional regulator with XRE-family HTH domain
MESQFGEKIRTLREQQHLYLRQIAPLLEMDTARLSKIEKRQDHLRKEQVPFLVKISIVYKEGLFILRLVN